MKRKKSKLERSKENPNSSYWLRKCDAAFGAWWHKQPRYCKVCAIEFGNFYVKAEMAHLIPRENYLWRWNEENVFELCARHHKFDPKISYHNASVAFGIWLQIHFPEKAAFVNEHKYESITRKAELPWTFQEKYEEIKGKIIS